MDIKPETNNPLLQQLRARLPGEKFRLPSQGIFYTNGELDSSIQNGELTVFPMTAYDEIILKTPEKLLSGEAVSDIFSRCIPGVKAPLSLLSKDVDFLMLCLRLITFGPEVTLSFDHKCKTTKDENGEVQVVENPQTYTIDIGTIVNNATQIDPTTVGSINSISVDSGQRVNLKPAAYKDTLKIYESLAFQKRKMLPSEDDLIAIQSQLIDLLATMIVDVDGITDQAQIAEWVRAIPSNWVTAMNNQAVAIGNWGVNTEVHVQCKHCKEDAVLDVPINPVNFFM